MKLNNITNNTINYLVNRKDEIIVYLFYLSIFLVYPLMVFVPGIWTVGVAYLTLFQSSTIVMLCTAGLCFKYQEIFAFLKKQPALIVLTLAFISVPIYHYFSHYTYTEEHLFASLRWILIPLFAFFYRQKLIKSFPYFILILWLFNLYHSLAFTINGTEMAGLIGNRNWHACFLVMSLPFVIKALWKFKEYKKLYWITHGVLSLVAGFVITFLFYKYNTYLIHLLPLTAKIVLYPTTLLKTIGKEDFLLFNFINLLMIKTFISVVISIGIFFLINFIIKNIPRYKDEIRISINPVIIVFLLTIVCFSRAGNLAFIIAFMIAVYLLSSSLWKKIILISIFIIVASLSVFESKKVDAVFEKLANEDVRLPLWFSTYAVIADNPLCGVGEPSFESTLAPYRSESYYKTDFVATRSNHPHNHTLYFGATNGVIILGLWLLVLFYPFCYIFIQAYRERKFDDIMLLYAFVCLFLHANLDLIFFEWPTNYIFLIILGIMWTKVFPLKTANSAKLRTSQPLKYCSYATGIMLMILIIVYIQREFRASYYYRKGETVKKRDAKKALEHYDRSINIKRIPRVLYLAGSTAFLRLNNMPLTLKYMRILIEGTPTKSYAHSNAFMGMALCATGSINESLPYLENEALHYKLSVNSWYRLFVIQKKLKFYKPALFSLNRILYSMDQKGLALEYLPIVIENMKLDLHPKIIPPTLNPYAPIYKKKYENLLKELTLPKGVSLLSLQKFLKLEKEKLEKEKNETLN